MGVAWQYNTCPFLFIRQNCAVHPDVLWKAKRLQPWECAWHLECRFRHLIQCKDYLLWQDILRQNLIHHAKGSWVEILSQSIVPSRLLIRLWWIRLSLSQSSKASHCNKTYKMNDHGTNQSRQTLLQSTVAGRSGESLFCDCNCISRLVSCRIVFKPWVDAFCT